MILRTVLVFVVAVLVTGCHLLDTQTGPSDQTPPTPVSLSGAVRANGTSAPVKGALVPK